MKFLQRLKNDLNRPGGGWTTGLLLITIAACGIPISIYLNRLVGGVWIVIFVLLHMNWGLAGYYPPKI